MKLSDRALRLISHSVLNTTEQDLPAANRALPAGAAAPHRNMPPVPTSQLNLRPLRKRPTAVVLPFRRRS